MPACLAREDLSWSIPLILVCHCVYIEGNFLFDLKHVASGRMEYKHGVKSIEIDLPKATLLDVPGNQEGAVPT
jgi:hypothetical protein